MERKTVRDKVWDDHYYDEMRNIFKPSSARGIEVVNELIDKPRFTQPDLVVEEGKAVSGDISSPRTVWVASYLYVFFKDGGHEDPYLTHCVSFENGLSDDEKENLLRKTKVHVSKDGTVTITSFDNKTTVGKLPIPDETIRERNAFQRMWETGWKFGSDE